MKVKDLVEKLSKVDQELNIRLYYSLGCGLTNIDVVFEDVYDGKDYIGVISKKNYESYLKYKKLKKIE